MRSEPDAAGERRLHAWTVWPAQLQLFGARADIQPRRDIRVDNPKAFRNHTSSKLGRDVMCESLLEERFFELLDPSDLVESYCEQPLSIPYLDGRFPRYFPDAQIALRDGRRILAEVKDARDLANYQDFRKWTAMFSFGHRPGFGVFIGSHEWSLPEALTHPLEPGLLEALATMAHGKDGLTQELMELLHVRHEPRG